jgi:hypothetical protein
VTAFASDVRHVLAIAADGFATFPAGNARFVRGELVRRAFGVRCAPALTRNFTLLGRIHRRKTTLAGICHRKSPSGLNRVLRELLTSLRQAATKSSMICARNADLASKQLIWRELQEAVLRHVAPMR